MVRDVRAKGDANVQGLQPTTANAPPCCIPLRHESTTMYPPLSAAGEMFCSTLRLSSGSTSPMSVKVTSAAKRQVMVDDRHGRISRA
jgi:hypothetical protein